LRVLRALPSNEFICHNMNIDIRSMFLARNDDFTLLNAELYD
jgi:hypothetical protein